MHLYGVSGSGKEQVLYMFSSVKNFIINYKKIFYFLGSLFLSVTLILFIMAQIASLGAARIFNREMERQKMLRGTITVETIRANFNGDVFFENLLWLEPDGDVILSVPEGFFHVRPWDVITKNFKSTTIQKLELKDALISVRFDEEMRLDFLEQKPHSGGNSVTDKKDRTAKIPEDTVADEETNFNRDGRRLRVDIVLNNCRLGAHYRKRHYIMNNVNMDLHLFTSGLSRINMSTGKFGGTMVGGGMSIAGTIDFKKKTPEADLDVSIRDVDPSSLGFGMNIHDLMTVVAKIEGPVTGPKGRGTVKMKELNIPALNFTDVIGDVNYSDAVFRFSDVHANVFGGSLIARGDYNLDTRWYNIYGIGKQLEAKRALKDLRFSCLVDLDLTVRCDGNPKNILVYGNFKSGKGHYSFIPFDSLEGRFTNRFKELHIYDAKIIALGATISTDAFSIVKGKLTMKPVRIADMDTGKVVTYERKSKKKTKKD